jgi:hypothetical protein
MITKDEASGSRFKLLKRGEEIQVCAKWHKFRERPCTMIRHIQQNMLNTLRSDLIWCCTTHSNEDTELKLQPGRQIAVYDFAKKPDLFSKKIL